MFYNLPMSSDGVGDRHHTTTHDPHGTQNIIRQLRTLASRLGVAALVLVLIITFGTLGFMLVEGWNWGDALYMTITTVSTVGYGEVRPLDAWGRVVAAAVVIGGVGVLAYALQNLTALAVEARTSGLVRRRRMEREIGKLRNHYIVCGFGRMGQMVVRQLLQEGNAVVIVDSNADSIQVAWQRELLALNGDATSDAVLREAGITHAHALIACSDSDAGNIFITLSARALNPKLYIIGRIGNSGNAGKMRIAGANHVISPYELGGLRMATLATRPSVAMYLDTLLHDDSVDFNLDEVQIRQPTSLRQLLQTLAPDPPNVLAILQQGENLVPHPEPDSNLQPGDCLIVVGNQAQVHAITQAAAGRSNAKALTCRFATSGDLPR